MTINAAATLQKLIEELEIELRKYFSTHPKEKWTANIANQNRRFYLHAVAQFLRLKSQSKLYCVEENTAA